MKGHIFFIMWISGSWKWTLINNLKLLDIEDFYFPLSYKTRKIRETEVNHNDAHFISREDFLASIEKWEFLEYAILYDGVEYYWTKFNDIKEGLDSLKKVIKELDIIWLEKLKETRKDFDNLYTTIFLDVSTQILKQRIHEREPFMEEDELNRRVNAALIEKDKAKELCDYIINTNKSTKEVLAEVLEIINKK